MKYRLAAHHTLASQRKITVMLWAMNLGSMTDPDGDPDLFVIMDLRSREEQRISVIFQRAIQLMVPGLLFEA